MRGAWVEYWDGDDWDEWCWMDTLDGAVKEAVRSSLVVKSRVWMDVGGVMRGLTVNGERLVVCEV